MTKPLLKNLHLIISLILIVPTAIIYGIYPTSLLPMFLDIPVTTNDLSNFLRAIMCLYLGVSVIWLLGTLNSKYWKVATQLNFLFMLSLGLGRLLSMIFDGMPSSAYIIGVIAELALALLSFYQLKQYGVKP